MIAGSRASRAMQPVVLFAAWLVVGVAVTLAFGQHRIPHLEVYAQAAVFGCLNALFAVGIVLVYRANRIINFGHASFGVLAAYLTMLLAIVWEWSYWIAVPLGVLAATAAGLLVQVFVVRRFAHAPRLVLTVATICVGQAIAGAAGLMPRLFGIRCTLTDIVSEGCTDPIPTNPLVSPFRGFAWKWDVIVFRGDHLVAVVVTVVVLAAMAAFFRLSSSGIAVRGAAENEDRASLLGINPQSLSTLVWVLAAGSAGLAAVLQVSVQAATLPNLAVGVGAGNLLRALTAAVLARMENLPVAVGAALGIALFERSVFEAFSQTAVVDGALLLAIIAALLVQRKRLARTEESISGSWAAAEEVRPVPAELAGLPVVRRGLRRVVVLGSLVVLAYPWVMSPSQTNLGSVYAIFGIVAVSLVVLTGWGGQISLGQFAFVAVGAVVGGAMTARWGWPFLLALPLASVVGAGAAVVLGLPALRIKGLYLAVTTMAFAVATTTVLLNERFFGWLLPRSGTIERPTILFIDTEDERAYYYLCVFCLALVVVAAQGLRQTRTGRVLIAMRDNERTAQSFGVNLVRTRLATFAIAGFFAAFAGVLYAHHQHAVSQSGFQPEQSISMFIMAVIGGLGSVPGALLGAIYLATVNIVVSGAAGQLLASGLGGLIVLLFYPGGLGSAAFALRDAWLRRIAIRDRIFVPSLLGEFRLFEGEGARAPLVARADGNGKPDALPARYRVKSRIGMAGASQRGRGWQF